MLSASSESSSKRENLVFRHFVEIFFSDSFSSSIFVSLVLPVSAFSTEFKVLDSSKEFKGLASSTNQKLQFCLKSLKLQLYLQSLMFQLYLPSLK